MRRILLLVLLIALAAAAYLVYVRAGSRENPAAAATGPGAGAGAGPAGAGAPGSRGPRGGPPGMGGGAFGRPPMTVELAPVTRADIADQIMVVGNLVGAATVEVVSKVSGRLQSVNVRIGDRVAKGSLIAQVEDREIAEQVKQAQASFEVQQATIRQREADLRFAETNLARARNLFERQLLPQQSLDDAEARYQAALAQLDLARAQFEQAKARLEELRITLGNTRIVSPVDGFVGRRHVDPGAYVSPNVPVASVVDISYVRLVANLVERDLRRVVPGSMAEVDVDAYPGEVFRGRVARVAPVLDPATRTAAMEIEVPNADARLKPGMYARVRLTVDQRPNALVIPRNAVVDIEGRRGAFVPDEENRRVSFREVRVGLLDDHRAEVLDGLREGERVVTTGAAALRDGDTILLAGQSGPEGPGAPRAAGRPGGPGAGGRGSPSGPAGPVPAGGRGPGGAR